MKRFATLFAAAAALAALCSSCTSINHPETTAMTIHGFTARGRNGTSLDLSTLKGKVLLVVNTATGCGFTPQYEGLEKLYAKYRDRGLEILDFPCDQFGHQAPGSDEEIHAFCALKYNTSFDQLAKIEVNGPAPTRSTSSSRPPARRTTRPSPRSPGCARSSPDTTSRAPKPPATSSGTSRSF